MRIQNAMIHDVTEGVDEHGSLYAKVILKGNFGECDHSFNLEDAEGRWHFKMLMNYTHSHENRDLRGKMVRVAIRDNRIHGIGHLRKDKFSPLCMCRELTKSELGKLIEEIYKYKNL